MIFWFESLSDPRSGELRSPRIMAPVFVLFAVAVAGVFYGELRLQKRRPQVTSKTQQRSAMKDEGAHAG